MCWQLTVNPRRVSLGHSTCRWLVDGLILLVKPHQHPSINCWCSLIGRIYPDCLELLLVHIVGLRQVLYVYIMIMVHVLLLVHGASLRPFHILVLI